MKPENDCNSSSCGCGVGRRDFLRLSTLAAIAAISDWPAIAGPFEEADFNNLIPTDKKLKPEWVKSIFERGEPEVFRGPGLENIGMPVGGICCGQVYLGGDGKLWHWDVFNRPQTSNFCDCNGPNYATPPKPISPISQGFAIKVTSGANSQTRALDATGFKLEHIAFKGQYPIGFVEYADPALPVKVSLAAFSPFIPLNVPDSSLPATLLRYTVKNTSAAAVEVTLAGWLENAAAQPVGDNRGLRRLAIRRERGFAILDGTVAPQPNKNTESPKRTDILFEDFENGYARWTAEGTAFGSEPPSGTLANQQDVSGFQDKHLVNTFQNGDATTGSLTSKPFKIERRHIAFLIGGGSHKDTAIHLLIDDKPVRSASGEDNEKLEWKAWNVAEFEGREARLQIVDKNTGAWGHINIDQITFTDTTPVAHPKLEQQDDFGSMSLALIGPAKDNIATSSIEGNPAEAAVNAPAQKTFQKSVPLHEKLTGALGRTLKLAPGEQQDVTFIIAWYFPGIIRDAIGGLIDIDKLRREYANRFKSAAEVAAYIVHNYDRLTKDTFLWNETWYDSTLPYWFLNRVFAPICTLATSTCYRFNTGRFYAFEGVYCCQGTCQHVWNYAHSVARIFPELERDLRQRTDFGTAWRENGAIDYRGECHRIVAHDGQCGVILRAYREHQTAPDNTYLRQCWPHIRKSIEYLMSCEGGEKGILEGEQYNTLDASWFGPMAWISSFYVAALRAGEAMATEMNDAAFAEKCRQTAESGSKLLTSLLYNGEYFIHKPDPKHPENTNTNNGCHIDQLMGQAWALQVGLPRVIAEKETQSALNAIWKYNFTPDIGPFRDKSPIRGGRWYAMAGEGGVIMTTFPHGGSDSATGKGHFAHYFNEVWTGQEHQLAAHMLWEGQAEKAMVITRVLHDRHHPRRRNPYNEVECSDHYTRAMASHGTFIAACGFEYHGPKAHIGFAPRLSPEDFKAPFTAATGWGVFTQKRDGNIQVETLKVNWGSLKIKTLSFESFKGIYPKLAMIDLDGKTLRASLTHEERRMTIVLEKEQILAPGQTLVLKLV
jgi:uncharacterized protein (DUF608 family)